MLTQTFSLAVLLGTGLASAQRQPLVIVDEAPYAFGDPFGIEATGEAFGLAPIQVTASNGRIYIGGNQTQPTNCSSAQTVHDFATFIWRSDRTFWLYGQDPAHAQQVWADVGADGLTGYSTGKEATPGQASLSPFEIDVNGTRIVTFNGVGAKGCPEDSTKPTTAPFGIWFSSEVKPGNLANCFDVTLKAYKTPYRDACTYSHLASCDEAPESCGSMKDPVGGIPPARE
ncbi:hypothetical protein CKM354_001210500 [Cercospora kikuchii]|uniref:Cell wall protein PhiA n=1 Tax=Cercospora kikuchii TaxID=84275 RepID=A0A9P3FLE9_9PEZI|nr:uncharacterized protein CKM354_001210500 [Cercospora kikuchii]GIZ49065.1 hypothetical protein CKM354_001210500 [Cercospora kikuchii]